MTQCSPASALPPSTRKAEPGSHGFRTNSSALTLARVAAGAAVETYTGTTTPRAYSTAEVQFRASGTWVSMGGEVFRLCRAATLVAGDARHALASRRGPLVITDRVSVDGGQSFYNTTRGAFAVEGDGTLLADDSGIMRRYSPSLFAATAARWPARRRVDQPGDRDGRRLRGVARRVAPAARHAVVVQHCCGIAGPAADLPFATGPLSALFTDWLTRGEHLSRPGRAAAAARRPAISAAVGEPLALLDAQRPDRRSRTSTPSSRAPPGTRASRPSARCMATGAACSSEVSTSLTDAVGWWTSSVYHRFLTMDADGALRSAAEGSPGSVAIMNGGHTGGLLVGPVMFPRGTYTVRRRSPTRSRPARAGLRSPTRWAQRSACGCPAGRSPASRCRPPADSRWPPARLQAGSVLLPRIR